mmetsp:Transcript_30914/g.104112  ORF Transcript_30914/g.104112 Transcript_30914/m.104112 type:complete len:202 (+) Transcript_30914:110-715(+)
MPQACRRLGSAVVWSQRGLLDAHFPHLILELFHEKQLGHDEAQLVVWRQPGDVAQAVWRGQFLEDFDPFHHRLQERVLLRLGHGSQFKRRLPLNSLHVLHLRRVRLHGRVAVRDGRLARSLGRHGPHLHRAAEGGVVWKVARDAVQTVAGPVSLPAEDFQHVPLKVDDHLVRHLLRLSEGRPELVPNLRQLQLRVARVEEL